MTTHIPRKKNKDMRMNMKKNSQKGNSPINYPLLRRVLQWLWWWGCRQIICKLRNSFWVLSEALCRSKDSWWNLWTNLISSPNYCKWNCSSIWAGYIKISEEEKIISLLQVENVLLPGRMYRQAIYQCNAGYALSSRTSDSMFCQEYGWTGMEVGL